MIEKEIITKIENELIFCKTNKYKSWDYRFPLSQNKRYIECFFAPFVLFNFNY